MDFCDNELVDMLIAKICWESEHRRKIQLKIPTAIHENAIIEKLRNL